MMYPPIMPPNWEEIKIIFTLGAFLRTFRLLPQMRRIESVLLAHLLLAADRAKLEFVLDQLRTCRIARAVASGTYILTLGFYFFVMRFSQTPRTFWFIVVLVGASIASTIIVRLAYSKLCSNPFSTLLVFTEQSALPKPKTPKVTDGDAEEVANGAAQFARHDANNTDAPGDAKLTSPGITSLDSTGAGRTSRSL